MAPPVLTADVEVPDIFPHEHAPRTADMASPARSVTPREDTPEMTPSPPDDQPPEPPSYTANPVYTLRFVNGERVFVERFPDARAGAPINDEQASQPNLRTYLMSIGTLSNPDCFETAELLMTTGLTNVGHDRHLKSKLYKGNMPWKNNAALLQDIDRLPHGPGWEVYEVSIEEDPGRMYTSYLFARNVVDIVRELIGNPAFKNHMRYVPERHWTAEDRKIRVYGETWTGDWWWVMQIVLPDKSATVVPVIIASDRTRLSTMCGGQQAYPVYATIGNISKSIRRKLGARATLLLGYLPVDTFDHVDDPVRRARLENEMTHRAMEKLMEPLQEVGRSGVEMQCADGRFRRIYPLSAANLGDWPEICMMGCTAENGCPKCRQKRKGRGGYGTPAPARTNYETLLALSRYFKTKDLDELDELGLKPWWPWWASLPYLHFSACLMPDLLHQLYQGMIKTHLIPWMTTKLKVKKIDTCFRVMPEAEGMRHFARGISKVMQWTGRESKEMTKQLLPVVAGHEEFEPNLTRLARTIIEFTMRAHSSRMTDDDLKRLEGALAEFHQLKDVLVDEKILKDSSQFDAIKKLHMLSHYSESIRAMGTPDGYNTESPEHLHIEYAKRGWRASNKVKPLPQMTKFIQRYEALRIHKAYMAEYYGLPSLDDKARRVSRVVYGEDEEELAPWPGLGLGSGSGEGGVADGGDGGDGESDDGDDGDDGEQVHYEREVVGPKTAAEAEQHVVYPDPTVSIAVKPTVKHVPAIDLINRYGAIDVIHALNTYLKKRSPGLLPTGFLAADHHQFNVWHRLYLRHCSLPFDPEFPRRDIIRAKPLDGRQTTGSGGGTFDVALFLDRPGEPGVHRYRAGRARVIFSLPKHLQHLCPHPLVYLELFTPFSSSISPFHSMHTTSQALAPDGRRRAIVIPIFSIAAACHLAPVWKHIPDSVNLRLQPDLLAATRTFYLNHYYNHFLFSLVEHWRAAQKANREREEERRRQKIIESRRLALERQQQRRRERQEWLQRERQERRQREREVVLRL